MRFLSFATDTMNQYIELQEPFTALKQVQKIKDAMMALCDIPEHHGVVMDTYLAARGIRKMPVDNYLVFYMENKVNEW